MSTPEAVRDEELDPAHRLYILGEQMRQAHSLLDDLGVPRGNGPVVWSVAGRLDWLKQRTVVRSCEQASNEHLCVTMTARWNRNHPEIGPTWESLPA